MKINKGVMCCVCLGTVIAILGISLIIRPRTKVVTDNNSNEKGKEVEMPINTLENMPTETYHIENGTVIFEKNIRKISSDMFHYNHEILHITLPETIEEIEQGSFAGSSLKTIDMSKAKCGLSLCLCEACYNLESVLLPNDVEIIPESAFDSCERLEEIVFPDTVKYIALEAFVRCTNMKHVEMKEGVKEIGSAAFKDCISLQDGLRLMKQLLV